MCYVGPTIANQTAVRRLMFVLVLAIVALVAVAMRRTQLPDCVLPPGVDVRLNLDQAADRQVLVDELAEIDVISARFRERIRSDPPVSTSTHARLTHATRPDRAYQYCEMVLRQELAKHHAIKLSDLPAPVESARAAE